jgi:2-aminoethylphosphonate-pyruvate transaminase
MPSRDDRSITWTRMMIDEILMPLILTPGPVTTALETRRAMLRDYTPNEPDLLALTAEIRRYAVEVAGGDADYTCVLMQGTGNAANEAALGTLVPRDRKLLVVSNGFYGTRLLEIARAIDLDVVALDLPQLEPVRPEQVEAALADEPRISHVVVCHVDTGTGIQNPIERIAEVARRRGVRLIVDAIASFGGLPIDAPALDLEALIASPNKWLEGVPGLGIAIVRRNALIAAEGRCHSFCLDLHRQWQSFERSGHWRFTPPTHAAAALAAALRSHAGEGCSARLARVRANWRCLVLGLRALGIETIIGDEAAAPVIATFHEPADAAYDRAAFFEAMRRRGFVIFRGCLTAVPTFRIGCMGAFGPEVMARVVRSVGEAMAEIGVRDCRKAPQDVAAAD